SKPPLTRSVPMNALASATPGVRVGTGVRVRVGVRVGVVSVACGVSVALAAAPAIVGVALAGGAPSKWTASTYTVSPAEPCAPTSTFTSEVSGTSKSKEIVSQTFGADGAYSWLKVIDWLIVDTRAKT